MNKNQTIGPWPSKLKKVLGNQQVMTQCSLEYDNPPPSDKLTWRSAAVLIPVVLHTEPTVLLTRRSDHLHHHGGQISFPGGGTEAGDADAIATALRETKEELGIDSHLPEIMGQLPKYYTITGFCITPVVATLSPSFSVVPDPFEVTEVFEVPLSFFLCSSHYQRHRVTYQGQTHYYVAVPYQNYDIWGATAAILQKFAKILMT